MNRLNTLLDKAASSPFYLWLLNRLLWRMVPFNAPHRFEVNAVSRDLLVIEMPYRRQNLNHIKGLHACGLATLCEYACGLNLMHHLGAAKYRIIMQKMEMNYLYQAKTAVQVSFELTSSWLDEHVLIPLEKAESVLVDLTVHVQDKNKKEVCLGVITWQIKPWSSVRTKV